MLNHDKLETLVSAAEAYYSTMHEQMRRADDLYNQRYQGTVELPENIEVFRSSRASGAVNDLRDQIRVDEPNILAHIIGTSNKAKELLATQQMWGLQVFRKLAEDTVADPFAQVPFDLLLRGGACVKTLVKPEALLNRPAPNRGEGKAAFNKRLKEWRGTKADTVPYLVIPLDPLNVMPSPGLGPMRYIIEKQTRRVMDMEESYPDWTGKPAADLDRAARANPLRKVTWIEFWGWHYKKETDEWEGDYIVEVDGERIIEEANPYGLVPYAWRYSGLGRRNHDGNPATQAITILTGILGELEEEIKVKTAMSAQWQYHVFPRLKVQGMSAADAARKFQKGPGAVIEIPPQGTVEWMETVPPNPQMMEYLSGIEAAIERRISPSLSGERTADFGIHQALQIGQALKTLTPVKSALNNIGSEVLNILAFLHERFDLSMNVNGTLDGVESSRMITGADLKHRNFEVTFEAVDPAENDRRMLALLSVMREPGLLSRETMRKIALRGIIDSNEEEEVRVMSERAQDQFVESGMLLDTMMKEIATFREQGQLEEAGAGIASQVTAAGGAAAQGVSAREQGIEALTGEGVVGETQQSAQQVQGEV